MLARYNDSGLEGLTDQSRRPYRNANQLPRLRHRSAIGSMPCRAFRCRFTSKVCLPKVGPVSGRRHA
nr:hypothetical protein [Mesorhizobium sp.]